MRQGHNRRDFLIVKDTSQIPNVDIDAFCVSTSGPEDNDASVSAPHQNPAQQNTNGENLTENVRTKIPATAHWAKLPTVESYILSVDDQETHFISGGLRIKVENGGIELAKETFASPVISAVKLDKGWVLVLKDGTIRRSVG